MVLLYLFPRPRRSGVWDLEECGNPALERGFRQFDNQVCCRAWVASFPFLMRRTMMSANKGVPIARVNVAFRDDTRL